MIGPPTIDNLPSRMSICQLKLIRMQSSAVGHFRKTGLRIDPIEACGFRSYLTHGIPWQIYSEGTLVIGDMSLRGRVDNRPPTGGIPAVCIYPVRGISTAKIDNLPPIDL